MTSSGKAQQAANNGSAAKTDVDVIIAGAGPVGSVLALKLAQSDISVLLLEQHNSPPIDLRASTFHPPSLEMISTLGDTVLTEMLSKGLKVSHYQYRDRVTGDVAQFDMELIADETAYPFRLQLEQYELTHIIAERLKKTTNVEHLFGNRVVGFTQSDDNVNVQVKQHEAIQSYTAQFLVGADGAGSQVRKAAAIEYSGFTYDEKFLVVSTEFPFESVFENLSWVNYVSDPEEWCVILRTDKIWRVLFPSEPGDDEPLLLSDDYIQRRLQHLHKRDQDYDVQHRTLYNVHQRVAETYVKGRVALAGDACHINNPLGGMGMNGGLHDAFNLADKLNNILTLRMAHNDQLQSYDRQRRELAVDFVQKHTIDNKKLMEAKDPRLQRTRQEHLMKTAADPQLAKEFIMERAMFYCLRDSLAKN